MKKAFVKALALVLTLALALGLAACGGAPSTPAPGPGSTAGSQAGTPAEPTTLKVYTWWDSTKVEHLQTR